MTLREYGEKLFGSDVEGGQGENIIYSLSRFSYMDLKDWGCKPEDMHRLKEAINKKLLTC